MFRPPIIAAGAAFPAQLKRYCSARLPGVCFCLLVVLAASYIREHYGSSQIIGALLLGMAFNSISHYREFAPGLEFCAKNLLRFGVALLGARITFSQIAELGWQPLLVVSCAMGLTLLFSVLLAKSLRLDRVSGIISGAAVGICGVSAAMVVASVLHSKIHHNTSAEQHLMCTLVGITGMSTICMILYPGLITSLGLDPQQMGVFLGASIHDVAQVVGAGQMISPQVAELAAYSKMLRVALLIPVVVVLAWAYRGPQAGAGRWHQALPPFLLLFIGCVVLANTGALSAPTAAVMGQVSQVCLWLAMAALGARTNLVDLWRVGYNPLLLLFLNTIFIAVVSLTLVVL